MAMMRELQLRHANGIRHCRAACMLRVNAQQPRGSRPPAALTTSGSSGAVDSGGPRCSVLDVAASQAAGAVHILNSTHTLQLQRIIKPARTAASQPPGRCCGYTQLVVVDTQQSPDAATSPQHGEVLTNPVYALVGVTACGRAPEPGRKRCKRHLFAHPFEIWGVGAAPPSARTGPPSSPAAQAALLFTCGATGELAKWLGVPAGWVVGIQDHWGAFGVSYADLLAAPGRQIQLPDAAQALSAAGDLPLWRRAQLGIQASRHNAGLTGLQGPGQPRLLTPVRQSVIVAFKDSSAVPMPMSLYDVLRLDPEATWFTPTPELRETARLAYEELVVTPTQAAYSADTLFSRAVLLKSAAETLGDATARKGYDQKLGLGLREIKVPRADVPGALVLLQESGEFEATISLATAWLGEAGEQDVGDVVTCLALALCDRAAAALGPPEQQPGRAQAGLLAACEDMERALALCREHDVAPALQDHISDALKGYAHAYPLALLGLPLTPANTARRAHGLTLTKRALAAPAPSAAEGHQDVAKIDEFLDAARRVLTASEQVQLHTDVAASPAISVRPAAAATAAYDAALALVAEGLTRGWPHLLHRADGLLREAERGASDHQGNPVSLERACIAVLLGNYSVGASLLGLGAAGQPPGAPDVGPDPEVLSFIQANSGGTLDDPRPGLKALAQSWAAEAVLPGFREWRDEAWAGGAGRGAVARQWWQRAVSPGAWMYLQVRARVRFEPALYAAHLALCVLPSVLAGLLMQRMGEAAAPASDTAALAATLPPSSQRAQGAQPGRVHSQSDPAGSDGWVGGSEKVTPVPLPTLTEDAMLPPMSDMAASEHALRRQLRRMERSMWEAPGLAAAGEGSSDFPLVRVALSGLARVLGVAALMIAVWAAALGPERFTLATQRVAFIAAGSARRFRATSS